jgi:hypothetical protein
MYRQIDSLYIYWGLHRAADQIEGDPNSYNYRVSFVPKREEGECMACALGWFNFYTRTAKPGDILNATMYSRFDAKMNEYAMKVVGVSSYVPAWRSHAYLAAQTLRKWAETEYKPRRTPWGLILPYQRMGTPGVDAPYLDDYL